MEGEFRTWIVDLQEEKREMHGVLAKIDTLEGVQKSIRTRLHKVAELISESIDALTSKFESGMNDFNENQLTKCREEYIRLMESIDSFHNTINIDNFIPNYIRSTFASRKRSISNKILHERPLSSVREERKTAKGTELFNSCKSIKRKLDDHTHDDYERRLRKLEAERIEMKKKLGFLAEEVSENLEEVRSLNKRLAAIDVGRCN